MVLKFNFRITIGSYDAVQTEYLSETGYSARFENIQTPDYHQNDFRATFYYDGQTEDIRINGWTFCPYIQGSYRIYNVIPADSPKFVIRALDPQQHQYECEVYTNGFFKEAAEDYLNLIHLLSKFPNREYADSFYKLKMRNNCNFRIGTEDLLPLLQSIKEYYGRYHDEENTDELFWGQLKDTYNEAVDDYTESLDSMKIE